MGEEVGIGSLESDFAVVEARNVRIAAAVYVACADVQQQRGVIV
jgi:hypothetical protein